MPSPYRCSAFSIVIATYRRADMLRDTVLSLRQLEIPEGVGCEVLIIDNDPQGSAREAVSELEPQCREFTLRYVHEVRTGLSYARNRGIEEARGDVIAFLDDDMFIEPQWMRAIVDCMHQNDAAVVGGRTMIHWEDPPDPIILQCERRLMALDYGQRDFVMQGCQLPGGGNAAFRRSLFQEGLRFSTKLGRVGAVLLSGEDTQLFRELQDRGVDIWYCHGAAVLHRTKGERTTCEYLLRQKYWFGISYAIIDRQRRGRLYQIGRAAARAAKALALDVPQFLCALGTRNKERQFLSRCSLASQAGYVRAVLLPLAVAEPTEAPGRSEPSAADDSRPGSLGPERRPAETVAAEH